MERICSRCGCSSFHYNHSRMRMECDSCGTPVYDPQRDQQLMQFDQTYYHAMSHLAAGNWEQTIKLLKPLLSQYPAEKKLYLAILRAATQDFRDIEMNNAANKTIANEAWDKLVRLNGVNGEMLRYGRLRYEKHREELNDQKNKILIWIFFAAFCSILTGILWGIGYYFIAVICIGGFPACIYRVIRLHPITTIKQLISVVPDYRDNPFV